ncbi:MAG TPA: CARDB domain-containing protein [Polyangiaceae bacterium]|jgi:hypothetical protein
MSKPRSFSRTLVGLFAVASTAACVANTNAPDEAQASPQAGHEAEKINDETGIIIRKFYPNLTVEQKDQNGSPGFLVSNSGIVNAGAFRIAVFAGQDSYSAYSNGIPGFGSQWFPMNWNVGCCQNVAILVDIDKQVAESNESDNGTGFLNSCQTYTCSFCNDSTCQCGGGLEVCTDQSNPPTSPNVCANHRGVDSQIGCSEQS